MIRVMAINFVVIILVNAVFSVPSSGLFVARIFTNPSLVIHCDILLPHDCWKEGQIFAPFRNS